MSDSKEAYISFVHASKGASPGWGGGSRLVNIIGTYSFFLVVHYFIISLFYYLTIFLP